MREQLGAVEEAIRRPVAAAGSPAELAMLTRFGRRTLGFWRAVGLRVTGLFGGSALHFADSFLHFFARLERDDKLLWDKDFITCPGVAGLACRPSFDLKNTEISQFDAVIFDERFDDCVERLLDDFLRLELGKPNFLGDGFNNLFLGHVETPLE